VSSQAAGRCQRKRAVGGPHHTQCPSGRLLTLRRGSGGAVRSPCSPQPSLNGLRRRGLGVGCWTCRQPYAQCGWMDVARAGLLVCSTARMSVAQSRCAMCAISDQLGHGSGPVGNSAALASVSARIPGPPELDPVPPCHEMRDSRCLPDERTCIRFSCADQTCWAAAELAVCLPVCFRRVCTLREVERGHGRSERSDGE